MKAIGHQDFFGWYFVMNNKKIGAFNWQNNMSFEYRFADYDEKKDWHST